MEDVWVAFGLTLFAGMATGIGSLIAFVAKKTNCRFLAISTDFSADVMLYISFMEIFLKGADFLTGSYRLFTYSSVFGFSDFAFDS